MNILAVDTSGPVAGIAILKDGCVTFEETVVNKLTHSANLMPMIDAALSRTGMTLKDMHRLAVVVGPGSFTGVRIGVSTVKGLSHGSGIPCVAVDALQAMAAGVPYFDGIVCPIQDARAGQVYGAAFTAGEVPTRALRGCSSEAGGLCCTGEVFRSALLLPWGRDACASRPIGRTARRSSDIRIGECQLSAPCIGGAAGCTAGCAGA